MLTAEESRRWGRELTSLTSMVFIDLNRNVRLLEKHVGTPIDAGFDQVLDELLS